MKEFFIVIRRDNSVTEEKWNAYFDLIDRFLKANKDRLFLQEDWCDDRTACWHTCFPVAIEEWVFKKLGELARQYQPNGAPLSVYATEGRVESIHFP